MSHRQPVLAVRTAQCTYAPANPFKPQPHPACAQVAAANPHVSIADASREADVAPSEQTSLDAQVVLPVFPDQQPADRRRAIRDLHDLRFNGKITGDWTQEARRTEIDEPCGCPQSECRNVMELPK